MEQPALNTNPQLQQSFSGDRRLSDAPGTDTDLIVARKVQAALVPRRLPSLEGIEMSSLYLPSSSLAGGDLFDCIQLSEDELVFFMFEVKGHRIASALISAFAKVRFLSHIRAFRSPRVVIEQVNSEIMRDVSPDVYLTAFVGYLNLHDNKLTYSNAGHCNPVVFRKDDGALVQLKPQGTLVGIFDKGYYDEQTLFLNPGDWLAIFTDGILKSWDGGGEAAAREAFDRAVAAEMPRATPAGLVEWIRVRCEERFARTAQDDDVSLVAVEVLTQSRRNQIKEKLGFSADDPVYLQTISYYEELDRAAGIILSAMDVFGYPDEIIRKMKVSLTELLVNAIHHGNGRDYTKKVSIGHVVDGKKTVVSIMDEGPGFNPRSVPDPTLPENLAKDCGRGLYIVRHYVDKMEFNAPGNRITITKFHPYE
jgi:anti-sigma regulatory factor (Ser/Thr protein kinase)